MNEVEVRNIGTPFYVFDIDVLKKRINYLKSMMPSNVELCYAMKANPFVVKKMEDIIKKYEICSYGEWSIAHGLMVDGSKMVISGVYKNEEEMIDIINNKSNSEVFTVESVNQLKLLDKITKDKKVFIDCILRLTSGNQFGMTEEEIEHILNNRDEYNYLNIMGIQYFSGTQKKLERRILKELEYVDRKSVV